MDFRLEASLRVAALVFGMINRNRNSFLMIGDVPVKRIKIKTFSGSPDPLRGTRHLNEGWI